MPRRPRIALAGLPLQIIQRGNNRSACFFSDDDHAAYLYWLRRYAARFRVRIHAYVLMTNHVHLLVTPPAPAQLFGSTIEIVDPEVARRKCCEA